MRQEWATLVAAGLPDGAPRRRGELGHPASTREAVRALVDAPLAPRERELLLAWLAAWKHHWPGTFAATLGPLGPALLERLLADPPDWNRYLKLRRIAVANLARLG